MPSSSPRHKSPCWQRQMLWGIISPEQVPRAEVLDLGLEPPSFLGKTFYTWDSPSCLSVSVQGMGLEKRLSLPLLPILVCFLYIFSCRRAILLVFQVILKGNYSLCSCSSGVFMRVGEWASSYLAILIPTPALIWSRTFPWLIIAYSNIFVLLFLNVIYFFWLHWVLAATQAFL